MDFKTNKIANVIYGSGVACIVLTIMGGVILLDTFDATIVIPSLFFGLLLGLAFIGLAELIELQDKQYQEIKALNEKFLDSKYCLNPSTNTSQSKIKFEDLPNL